MTASLGKAAAAVMASPLLGSPSAGSTGYRSYGLGMYFTVKVNGMKGLGNWSACQGLSVNFAPDQLREGGQYEHPWYLPGEVTYGQVTLERAMQKGSSETVRTWLKSVMRKWITSNNTGEAYKGEPVDITLFDGHGVEVASWTLNNAVPVAWLGPSLSGHSNDVAIERLQFAHRGFLTDATDDSPTPTAGSTKLTLKKSDAESVSFSYNPTSMSIVRATTFRSEGALVAYQQQQVVDIEKLSITVHNLRLEGEKQVGKVPTLFGWLQPKQGAKQESKGGTNQAEAQRLELKMGDGIHYEVTLNKLDVKYTRFSREGVPIRAEVGITLADAKQKTPKQNPTSGGPPGVRAHTVTEGDNLPRIAQATCADPNAWRDIAAANGIDDPLRVRNGRVLLLPGGSGR
jgi:phage tail-like protein